MIEFWGPGFVERVIILLCFAVIIVEVFHLISLRQEIEVLKRENIILREFLRENKAG